MEMPRRSMMERREREGSRRAARIRRSVGVRLRGVPGIVRVLYGIT
jgi:hypothetical protein